MPGACQRAVERYRLVADDQPEDGVGLGSGIGVVGLSAMAAWHTKEDRHRCDAGLGEARAVDDGANEATVGQSDSGSVDGSASTGRLH